MVFRFLSALLRAGIAFFLIVFPSSILADPNAGNFGAIVVFALVTGIVVFFEYMAFTPSLIEFRYAPPYNRFRVLVYAFIAVFIVTSLNANNQMGPIFELVDFVAQGANATFAHSWDPATVLANSLRLPDGADRESFIILAHGALFVAIFSALLFCLVIWLQRWPLSNAGFNLWPNMPSFHAQAGSKTESRMAQIALLSLSLAFAAPYLIPRVGQLVLDWMSFNYNYTHHSAFWIISFWAMFTAMTLMRGIVLLKVAYLASQMRSMNQAKQQA
ncbi:hypothetical protein GCM10008927_10260 [Amylibacter ulvae]|uniref:Uncharacterized protein n=1 Tax=Paramylibacter ulvae TaxID=1651968 RepID=A0ABQ3CXP1_9RHOB|nr:hypothetical protein [Amylibacter ulvae]GHA47394.1 hypothetical protein GCM10008927_10260 [Amylibacter ulvae]